MPMSTATTPTTATTMTTTMGSVPMTRTAATPLHATQTTAETPVLGPVVPGQTAR